MIYNLSSVSFLDELVFAMTFLRSPEHFTSSDTADTPTDTEDDTDQLPKDGDDESNEDLLYKALREIVE